MVLTAWPSMGCDGTVCRSPAPGVWTWLHLNVDVGCDGPRLCRGNALGGELNEARGSAVEGVVLFAVAADHHPTWTT